MLVVFKLNQLAWVVSVVSSVSAATYYTSGAVKYLGSQLNNCNTLKSFVYLMWTAFVQPNEQPQKSPLQNKSNNLKMLSVEVDCHPPPPKGTKISSKVIIRNDLL